MIYWGKKEQKEKDEQLEQEIHNLNENAALKNQENTFTTTNTFNGVINVQAPTSDNNATNKHYVDSRDVKTVEMRNFTFNRQQKPTRLEANKYWYDLNFSTASIPNNSKIISVVLKNRAYDQWNGHLSYYLGTNKISIEIWNYENDEDNKVEELKQQIIQIAYISGE